MGEGDGSGRAREGDWAFKGLRMRGVKRATSILTMNRQARGLARCFEDRG